MRAIPILLACASLLGTIVAKSADEMVTLADTYLKIPKGWLQISAYASTYSGQ